MEAVFSIYQLTNTLIAVYGYWKIANISYDSYSRAKILFDLTVSVFDKVQKLIDGPNSKHLSKLQLDQIEDIKNDIEKHKNLPRVYYSKEPFKTHWEIIHKNEIKKEIENEKVSISSYYLPNVISFYSWSDENGDTITEL
jgi:hypothetical protein